MSEKKPKKGKKHKKDHPPEKRDEEQFIDESLTDDLGLNTAQEDY